MKNIATSFAHHSSVKLLVFSTTLILASASLGSLVYFGISGTSKSVPTKGKSQLELVKNELGQKGIQNTPSSHKKNTESSEENLGYVPYPTGSKAKNPINQSPSTTRSQRNSSYSYPENQTTYIRVGLTIDSGVRKHSFTMTVHKGDSVLALLQEASRRYGFSLDYSTGSAYGAFIEEIDGVRNNPSRGMYWIYYLNGRYASLGASSQKLSSGDEVLWKYQSTR